MEKYNILVMDDMEENLTTTKSLLRRWGYEVDAVSTAGDALEFIKTQAREYSVAILDYQMSGKSGTEVAQEIRSLNDEIVLLIYSAYPSLESLKATIRAGALNFIDKSEDLNLLKVAVEKACQEFEKVRKSKPKLSSNESAKIIASIGLIGQSEQMARVAEKVIRYGASKRSVLILGETGVGKERLARAMHRGRDDTYFVVNCASLQGSGLVESELFGYEKGAFTGAVGSKAGILEGVRGGSVYFDELHFLDYGTQGKLLRALREKKIRKVGGMHEIAVDFRAIGSSQPSLVENIEKKTFLPDLYYRFNQLPLYVPALRERPEDIEPLVAHYCERHFQETGIRKQFLARTIRKMELYPWNGNVPELESVVSLILLESGKTKIDLSELEDRIKAHETRITNLSELEQRQDKEKRDLIESVLKTRV